MWSSVLPQGNGPPRKLRPLGVLFLLPLLSWSSSRHSLSLLEISTSGLQKWPRLACHVHVTDSCLVFFFFFLTPIPINYYLRPSWFKELLTVHGDFFSFLFFFCYQWPVSYRQLDPKLHSHLMSSLSQNNAQKTSQPPGLLRLLLSVVGLDSPGAHFTDIHLKVLCSRKREQGPQTTEAG